MKWESVIVSQPKDWNPMDCLARLALQTTRAKVKGRPPRMQEGSAEPELLRMLVELGVLVLLLAALFGWLSSHN